MRPERTGREIVYLHPDCFNQRGELKPAVAGMLKVFPGAADYLSYAPPSEELLEAILATEQFDETSKGIILSVAGNFESWVNSINQGRQETTELARQAIAGLYQAIGCSASQVNELLRGEKFKRFVSEEDHQSMFTREGGEDGAQTGAKHDYELYEYDSFPGGMRIDGASQELEITEDAAEFSQTGYAAIPGAGGEAEINQYDNSFHSRVTGAGGGAIFVKMRGSVPDRKMRVKVRNTSFKR